MNTSAHPVSYEAIDLFTDHALNANPYPYFEYLRTLGGAVRLPGRAVVAIVGFDEALSVMRDDESFSAVNAASGFSIALPFVPQGDDITGQIAQNRGKIPNAGLIVTEDPPVHTKLRSLLRGLITPRRLKANEDYMSRTADRLIKGFVGQGTINVARDYGRVFPTLVIADLLGVPETDRQKFAELLRAAPGLPGDLSGNQAFVHNPLETIGKIIFGYIVKRRLANTWPARMGRNVLASLGSGAHAEQEDILTDLALTKYLDGSTPRVIDVVGVATFLFAAGQDTTAHLITSSLRYLAEDAQLQRRLRAERKLIPAFVEEMLRLQGTVKTMFRLVRKRVNIGGIDIAPGTTVMTLLAAVNRDPKRFDRPDEIVLERANLRDNVAFSRGIHACPGSPLARAETRITLERLFDHTTDIRINDAQHGPQEARRYDYLPTYMFRGIQDLYLDIS